MSVVTLVAVNKYTAINYPQRARGLGALLAHSPLWAAVDIHDRHHLRVQLSGVQQGKRLLFPETAQKTFRNTLGSGILHLIGYNAPNTLL